MGIPSPLAFPPTAIRNVAAGLVVGNPIGSSGTRGKALTAAELKAIVEASGISYLPLSGGTLTGALSLGSNGFTCGAITASGAAKFNNYSASKYWQFETGANGIFRYYSAAGPSYNFQIMGDSTGSGGSPRVMFTSGGSIEWGDNASSISVSTMDLILKRANAGVLAQRNGINAQCFLLNKTYTSDTSQEALMLDAGKQISGKLGLYSYRGSSGGSNYPIQIGMLAADGSTFSGLTVGTDGVVASTGTIASGNRVTAVGQIFAGTGGLFFQQGTRSGIDSPADGRIVLYNNATSGFDRLQFGGTSSLFPCLKRSSATLAARLADDSADAALTCAAITASGQISSTPPASVTLATNGQFSIEMTSNTAGNLVYRGSDGTTRRMALLFA